MFRETFKMAAIMTHKPKRMQEQKTNNIPAQRDVQAQNDTNIPAHGERESKSKMSNVKRSEKE